MTPREELASLVGEETVPVVTKWLRDVLDKHSLEVDDVTYSPSLDWLVWVLGA